MKKYWKLIVCLLVLTVLIAGCGENVVAKVNDKKITETEFNKQLKQVFLQNGIDIDSEDGQAIKEMYQEMFLEDMINKELLYQDAVAKGITADEKIVEENMKKVKADFPTTKAYEEQLKSMEITEEELEDSIRKSLMLQELLEKVIVKDVTTPSIDPKTYYDEHKEEYMLPETVDVRHILVKTEEEAKEVIKQLDEGKEFTELVAEKSLDPTAQDNQGLIEGIAQGSNFYQEFIDGAFSLKTVGKYTKEPVQTPVGFHIIKLEGKEKAKQQTYDEVKDQLYEDLLNVEKDEKFQAYMLDLQNNAKIERNLPEKKEENPDEQKDAAADDAEETESGADTSENNADKAAD